MRYRNLLPAMMAFALAFVLVPVKAFAVERAVAEFIDTQGRSIGRANLEETPHGVLLTIRVDGLSPGPKAFHIHERGTCEDPEAEFDAAGAHLGSATAKHGLRHPEGPEAGDLPNLVAGEDGAVRAELFTTMVSLGGAEGRTTMLDEDGAALVIHEDADDHFSQPIGGAGSPVACGVIVAVATPADQNHESAGN